ncbi:MAG TPA: DUF2007 domain-containing protein [Bryobacteraceae bacterium]|jgi:hypothetical protein|nr:DUF2007 domain-containing protein [Bryobacteraceae bacterium]
MNISADDYRRHFELLSDAALLSTSRDDLVEAARHCYDEEVSRRGLNEAEDPGEEEPAEGEAAAHSGDEVGVVEIATYTVSEEASLARGLLESAGIPSRIDVNYTLGPVELRLLVSEDMVEQALEILESEISEEELAAQAEAAGFVEEEFDESEADAEEAEAETEDGHPSSAAR